MPDCVFTVLGEGRARLVYAKWLVAPLSTVKHNGFVFALPFALLPFALLSLVFPFALLTLPCCLLLCLLLCLAFPKVFLGFPHFLVGVLCPTAAGACGAFA